jgi:hypothetical protein
MTDSLQHPYVHFEGTQSWRALDASLTALVKNGDVIEQTDRRYIVGALCKALADEGIETCQ